MNGPNDWPMRNPAIAAPAPTGRPTFNVTAWTETTGSVVFTETPIRTLHSPRIRIELPQTSAMLHAPMPSTSATTIKRAAPNRSLSQP